MDYIKRCDICASDRIERLDAKTDLCRCKDCAFTFHNPRPAAADIAAYYSRADKYDSWAKEGPGRDLLWRNRLAKIEGHCAGGSILDIGAGIGQFLFHAKRDFYITGTEVSASAVKTAKDRYGIGLIRGNIEDIDFGDKRFDVITIFHTLEHAHSPSSLIKRCSSLLKDDGILIVAVPNEINSIQSIIKRAVKRLLSILPVSRFKRYGALGIPRIALDGSLDEIHLSYFTVDSLERLLRNNGFTVIEESGDPYYASTGLKRCLDDLVYAFFGAVKALSGINVYDAIWITARLNKK